MKQKLLIFSPGYNVEKTVEKAMTNLVKLHKKLEFDAVYIDNCSTDDSVKLAEKAIKKNKANYIKIIQNKKNLGYGGTQKVAFKYAFEKKYDYLMEYDADLQYSYEDIPRIYDKIKNSKASVVFGSRVTKKEHSEEMGFLKRMGNSFLNDLNNWAFNFNVTEIHTGFRIYNLNLLKGLDLSKVNVDYRWSLDSVVEVIKINKSLAEIPIKGYYHKDKSSPSFKHLVVYTTYMIKRAFMYKLFRK